MRRLLTVTILCLVLSTVATAGASSVDEVTFESNSDFFAGDVFVLKFLSNFDTDTINAGLSQSQLEQEADGEVSQDLSIYANTQTSYARYSISPADEPKLVPLDLTTTTKDTLSGLETWAANTCYDTDGDGQAEFFRHSVPSWDIQDWKGYCAFENGQYGPVGRIQENGDEIFETEFCVEASGKSPECRVLSNGDAGQGVRTDLGTHVKIRWDGNLETGKAAPGAADAYAMHGNQFPGGWRIISKADYGAWKGFVRDLPDKYQSWGQNDLDRSTLESDMDFFAEEAARTYTESPLSSATRVSSSFTDGLLELELPEELAYPAFTIYVDGANYITVTKETGVPDIVSTSGDRFGELDTGEITASVRNVGNGDGSFAGRITTCSDGFTFDSTQQTARVTEGETVTYKFPVSFTATTQEDEVSGTCTVEIAGVEARDTATVSVTGIQETECTPDERFSKINADGQHVIYRCTSDGMPGGVVTTCGADERAEPKNGQLQCVEKPGPGGGDGFVAQLSQMVDSVGESIEQLFNPLQNAWMAAKVLATLVFAILGFNTARNLVSGVERRAVRVGAALVVAGLVGVLVYSLFSSILFWVFLLGLIGIIVYVVGPTVILGALAQGYAASQ